MAFVEARSPSLAQGEMSSTQREAPIAILDRASDENARLQGKFHE